MLEMFGAARRQTNAGMWATALTLSVCLPGCNTFADAGPFDEQPDGGTSDAGAFANPGITGYQLGSSWTGGFDVPEEVDKIDVALSPADLGGPGWVTVVTKHPNGVELSVTELDDSETIAFGSAIAVPLAFGAGQSIDDINSVDMLASSADRQNLFISGIGSQADCPSRDPTDQIWSFHTQFDVSRGAFDDVRTTTGACAHSPTSPLELIFGPATIMETGTGFPRFVFREEVDGGTPLFSIGRDLLDPTSVVRTPESSGFGVTASRGGVWFREQSNGVSYWSATAAATDVGSEPAVAGSAEIATFEFGFDDGLFDVASLESIHTPTPVLVGIDNGTRYLSVVRTGCSFDIGPGESSIVESVECTDPDSRQFTEFGRLTAVRAAGNRYDYLAAIVGEESNSIQLLLIEDDTLTIGFDTTHELAGRQIVDLELDTFTLDTGDAFVVVVAVLTQSTDGDDQRVDVVVRQYTQ